MTLDELFTTARSGDPLARQALVEAIYRLLGSYFGKRCRYPDLEVDDLIQSTLTKLVGRIDSFDPTHPKAFEYLVYDTAHAVLQSERRRVIRAGRQALLTPDAVARDTSPSARVARRDQLGWVAKVVAELDSSDRQALRDWLDEIDWRELVEREGVARGTLRARLSRALARVRTRLGRANPALFAVTPSS